MSMRIKFFFNHFILLPLTAAAVMLIVACSSERIENNLHPDETDKSEVIETTDSTATDSCYCGEEIISSIREERCTAYYSEQQKSWCLRRLAHEDEPMQIYFCRNLPDSCQDDSRIFVVSGDLYHCTPAPDFYLDFGAEFYCVDLYSIWDADDFHHDIIAGCYSGEIVRLTKTHAYLVIRYVPEGDSFSNQVKKGVYIEISRDVIPEEICDIWNILNFKILDCKAYDKPQSAVFATAYICDVSLCE